jgi:hypothetical protein
MEGSEDIAADAIEAPVLQSRRLKHKPPAIQPRITRAAGPKYNKVEYKSAAFQLKPSDRTNTTVKAFQFAKKQPPAASTRTLSTLEDSNSATIKGASYLSRMVLYV